MIPIESPGPDLVTALANARSAVEDHMVRADRAGIIWREETVSELLWVHAHPHISCADFSRKQENRVGADWLWWWVDGSGECFGLLVQAKRLHHSQSQQPHAQLDFGHGDGEQFRRLVGTADRLGVPAAYIVYFGGVEHRYGLSCEADDHTSQCLPCKRRSVSVITALQAGMLLGASQRDAATGTFLYSKPLEDLVNPDLAARPIQDLNLCNVDMELRRLLLTPQVGARLVAKEVFRMVAEMRMGQLSAAVADRVELEDDIIFPDLPLDSGHFSRPYYPYVMRGLRRRLPDTVQHVLNGKPPPEEFHGVAGLVVVYC
ncbi:hypothetical protein [Micromonospora aurantiaca (nom. illeg.)]|uniref:hypothetical protein n=1 Tax=Micromonospora aurantiaca (nom. illeg.) TaxID=47850 RepID=UPI0001BF104C|nr:hypothetical protein [Micromonospora aurantiaca]ADL45975.1 hypothetical protein Micau_2434 [Micromonospora aurantiaca ATCC 27029]